jgi:hypothetical protein
MRSKFCTYVTGPALSSKEVIGALRTAGFSVTLYPPSTFCQATDEEVLEVCVAIESEWTIYEFSQRLATALADTGYEPSTGVLPN